MLEMSMSKGSTEAYTKQNCNRIIPGVLSGIGAFGAGFAGVAAMGAGPGLASAAFLPVAAGAVAVGAAANGCNFELDLSAGVGGLSTPFKGPGVKLGLEGGLNFEFHVEHSSSITNEEGIETSVSFGVGDPDDGDEVVLDIYHDEIFGSFVFDTVGGITKCRWEKGTIKGEDPRVRILFQPDQFIFPDKEIIFDIEFLNIGEHVYSYFLIAQDNDAETSALELRLDNFQNLDYEGVAIKLVKEVPEVRSIRITRGPQGYDFLPAKLALRSACEFAMDYETVPVAEYLYNYVKPGTNEKRLKWIEPCPAVQWAGELKRDQTFLRNTLLSSIKDSLTVTIFNPKHHEKNSTFVEKVVPNGRLEKISFLYRKQGTSIWRNGKMRSEMDLTDMDFAQSEESDYGFISLDWYIGDGLLQDASYEVMIEDECEKIAGPVEFQYARDSILIGAIDFNPPELYGYPQPLTEEVLLGQEMYVEFTEDLDCRTPFSFDIEMTIAGPSESPSSSPSAIPQTLSHDSTSDASFDRSLSENTDFVLRNGDGLHVICEGRRIKFQVDYTSGLSASQMNGQEFTVELGRIGGESVSYIADKNSNPIDHQTKGNVRFTKRFASMDLSRATTRFRLLKRNKNISCSVDGKRLLRSDLSQFSSLQIDDRLNISDIFCDETKSVLSAQVEIIPDPRGRRLLKGSSVSTSPDVFETLKGAFNNNESVGTEQRLLREAACYSIHNVRIIPCKDDTEKYGIDVNTEKGSREEVGTDAYHDFQDMRNDGNRKLKQSESVDKLQSIEGALLKMEEIENMRELKLKEHDQKLLDEMEKLKESQLKEMQRMKESEASMMKYQMVIFFGGCLFASFAAIQMMRRHNN